MSTNDETPNIPARVAAHEVFGRRARVVFFLSLALASYVYALDGSTTYIYLAFATSMFGGHSLLGAVQVAQGIVLAIGKPAVAKVADVTSRGTAYLVVLLFYTVGYIVVASARNVQSIAGGLVLYSFGNTGLQLLTQIVIADMTALKWRSLAGGLVTAPFIVNAFIGSLIAASVIEKAGWRWGYGMFALLVPAALSPLISTLLWAEHKAKQLNQTLSRPQDSEYPPLRRRLLDAADKMDLIGLVLLGAALSLVLVPLTINTRVRGGWHNGSIIAMLVTGCVILIIFGVWDVRFARYPIVKGRFLRNRSIVCGSLIGFFDFMSFYLTFTYLFSYIFVVKDWDLVDVVYFTSSQTVALTVFGILAGALLRILGRYKAVLISGLLIRLFGVGLMIHSRGANGSTVELIFTQIIQGLGGGFASATVQVAAQASVPHEDLALATALVLLVTEIGGAVGNAIAGAIWTNTMPGNLARFLPNTPQSVRDALFKSVVTARQRPRGDPIREGVILAYGETMKVMLIVATALAVVPVVLAFMMPNWVLGDEQNAVSGTKVRDERVAAQDTPREE